MKKLKFISLSILSVAAPLQLFAQSQIRDVTVSSDDVAYASFFAGDLSLLLSIVIGMIATFFVFRAAKRMGGGLFGSVLNYIALGMIFVVFGTISSFLSNWLGGVWFNAVNTVCFAGGYIFMVIGANKLLKGIIST